MNYLKKEFYKILKSDEEFFDFIQMNAFDGVWFWNLEKSDDKWINPNFCNLLGYKYQELQGNQIQKIVHQEDQAKIQEVFNKYLKNTQSVHEDEIRFVHKEGKVFWLKLKALVFGKKESQNHRVVITHTNITQQHKQEEQLEKTLERYESMLNNHSLFIIQTDLLGNYSYVNNHFCERLNLKRDDIIGKSAISIIIQEDHQKCRDAVYECFANPNQSAFVQLRKPIFDEKTNQTTKKIIYTDWEYRAILDKQGNIKEIQCVGIEVTDKILAQQAFQEKAKELEVSEEELRLNLEQLQETQYEVIHTQKLLEACNEAAQIGVWELNLMNYSTKWDKVIKDIHEVEDDFVSDAQNGILFYKEGYSRETITRIFTNALEEGIPFDEQLQIITAKGNEKWIRTIGIPTFENGKCIEMYGTFQDITEKKERELEVKEKVEELETTQSQLIHTQKLLDASNEAAQIGTWEVELNNLNVKWNKVTKQIHEVEDSFVVDTQNAINFFKAGYSRQIITRAFTKAVEEGISYDEQLKLITAKGNEIWVRTIGIPTFKNGKCVEIYGTIQNIDKQKRNKINLQQKLEELEVSQRHLLSTSKLLETCNASATIGTWNYDVNTKDIIWDLIVHNIYELPIDIELDTPAKINFFKKGHSREKVIKILQEAREDGIPFDEELELINFRGKHKWVRIIGLPQMENGRCVELYGTFQDITKQKQAELQFKEKVNELENAQQEIQKIQNKLSTTLEKTGIGLWEIDLQKNEIYWDNQLRKMLGATDLPEGALSRTNKFNYINEEDGKRINKHLNDFISGKVTSYHMVYQTIPIQGVIKFHESKAILIKDVTETPISILGITQDITYQKNAELQLKEKVNELENVQQEVQVIQNKLSITLEKTGVGLWELNLKTGKTEWDDQCYTIFHETKEEFAPERWQEKIHPEDLGYFFKNLEEISTSQSSILDIKSKMNHNNKMYYYHIKGVLIEERNEKVIIGTVLDITNQKSAELQLKEKVDELEKAQRKIQTIQNKLSTTLEKTGIGLWELDLTTNQPYWDKQTKRMFGVDENAKINSESAAKRVNADDVIKVNEMLVDLIKQKISQYHTIYKTVPINGKIRYHESKAVLIKDENDIPISVFGVTQDITKQKEHEQIIESQNKDLAVSEQELRKGIRKMYHLQRDLTSQKQQLEQIFDAVPALIYQFKRDKEGSVSFPLVSKGSELVLGVKSEEMLNDVSSDIFEAIHPEDLLGFQSSVQKSTDTMQKWESELRLLKNGKEVWIHATSKPTHTDDGGIIWTGIMQNIDQLKKTEIKIQQQNKQLQETLTELRETQSQLIHNEKMTTLGQLVASIAHEINTPLGAIHSSSASIEKMLKSTLSKLPKIMRLLSEKELEQFSSLIEKSIEANIIYSSREKRNLKYKLIDELDTQKIPQSDRIADVLVDIGIAQEEQLYEHFIKLPNAVQILEAAYQIATIANSNNTIQIATEKASKIIITLKNFSRQDHTGEKQVTNINESLENTLILYHNKLKYGIEVVKQMQDLPLINAYEDELAQVWTNLLHNAIQAIDMSRNKKGKVYLTTKRQENTILVVIKDTGQGISDEIQQKIFDAFFTTKPAGEGSGLGLNIVRKIVEKHNGKIWFETENIGENTGTTFFVELPIQ
ncbi:PAS domain-containing protein [Bernardetia sp. OM2101]|uniref:PAS domain-containing protein n=1 Tax=Bernardetia sp. OM2101 TaxID=3344876 RepID=UPI0035D03881